jgi:hypothetical protein
MVAANGQRLADGSGKLRELNGISPGPGFIIHSDDFGLQHVSALPRAFNYVSTLVKDCNCRNSLSNIVRSLLIPDKRSLQPGPDN